MYIGIPPPRVRRSATNSSSNKRQDQQGPSQLRIRSHSVIEIFDSPPPRIQPAFESAFDNDVRQPCLVCTECPDPLVSSRLRALFRYDPDSRQKLGIKLGLRCDLDLDTLLLLDQATRDKLFRESNMSDDLVARIKAILHSEEPKSHVNSGISENDLRRYISSVYPCKEHPVLSPSMKIPPHFLRTFNSVHMEHLLPLALLPFQSIGDGASFSPLQKAAILWALSTE
ncbi:hypothetical protein GYMLUDRAFT_741998 [Collybiopsis luxurians FD-317 M1]|uniref:Uncharacterized protein n=1 Tax=Collybiopsis luxurians FD-317 M1 TaxID=944289 RepID=A0A0D0CQH4_9AGAR|nr:hypothetical protein GYMLUDRAFT_741998 [Collybiopsis luxurians FD-317 M1]